MFKAAAMYLWDKTSGSIKYVLAIVLFLTLSPLKIREMAVNFVQKEVHAVVDPMKSNRDIEITAMKTDLADTKAYVRAIGIHLMGERRFKEEVGNTTVASDGTK